MIEFEAGKRYWLTYSDGSRLLVEAQVDSRGEFDLFNHSLDFFLWAGGNNLDVVKVELA